MTAFAHRQKELEGAVRRSKQLLHYSYDVDAVVEFSWYVVDTFPADVLNSQFRPTNLLYDRIPPSEWYQYREVHDFRTPCCLCPIDPDYGFYAETAIVLVPSPASDGTGQYAATCAKNICCYLGVFIFSLASAAQLLTKFGLLNFSAVALHAAWDLGEDVQSER